MSILLQSLCSACVNLLKSRFNFSNCNSLLPLPCFAVLCPRGRRNARTRIQVLLLQGKTKTNCAWMEVTYFIFHRFSHYLSLQSFNQAIDDNNYCICWFIFWNSYLFPFFFFLVCRILVNQFPRWLKAVSDILTYMVSFPSCFSAKGAEKKESINSFNLRSSWVSWRSPWNSLLPQVVLVGCTEKVLLHPGQSLPAFHIQLQLGDLPFGVFFLDLHAMKTD